MRPTILILLLTMFGLVGCSGQPEMRPDPIEVKGTVKLPGGASPKDLTVTFQPQQNTPPGGTKVGPDGSFSLQLTPGKYIVYFQDEANARVPAYKSVPESYRTPREGNIVSVSSGESLTIDVK